VKLSSILFAIIGASMMIAGLILGLVANSMATTAGHEFFAQRNDEDGNITMEYPIFGEGGIAGDRLITRILIEARNTDVVIFGGEVDGVPIERSRVVVYNMFFPFYSVNVSSGAVNITNMLDFGMLIETGGAGLEFNGIHSFLNRGMLRRRRQQQIRVYLSDDDLLHQIDLQLENVDLTMVNLSRETDIFINATGGTATLDNIRTDSTLRVDALNSNLTVQNVDFGNVAMNLENSEMVLDLSTMQSSFDFNIAPPEEDGELGSLTVNGNSFPGVFIQRRYFVPDNNDNDDEYEDNDAQSRDDGEIDEYVRVTIILNGGSLRLLYPR